MSRPRLFILDGTSGVWKQELMAYTAHRMGRALTVRKLTTRKPRDGEDFQKTDLRQMDLESFDEAHLDYKYEYGGQWYGFSKESIQSALQPDRVVFIIVRNAGIIRALRKDFGRYCPTTAFIYVDTSLAARRAQEMSSQLVKSGIEDAYLDYLREPELYDEVLVHADAANDLYRLVNVLVTRGKNKTQLSYQTQGRIPLAVSTSPSTRTAILTFNSLVGASGLGIAIDILAAGDWYAKILTLVLSVLVVLFSIIVTMIFIYGWQRN